jgi:hypothetical protein
VFSARTLSKAEWDRLWRNGIEKVVLVQRLREVMALVVSRGLKPPLRIGC